MPKHLLFAFIFISAIAAAQNPVPNFSFENWDDSGRPVGWNKSLTVTQTTPGHTGNFAVRGDKTGDLKSFSDSLPYGFPVPHGYSYFNFYYKFNRVAQENMWVDFTTDSFNHTICVLYQTIITTGASTFTPVSVPISCVSNAAATGRIYFSLGTDVGVVPAQSYYVIDDITLSDSPLSGIAESEAGVINFRISPNPATSYINLQATDLNNAAFTITNTLGQTMVKDKWYGSANSIDISHLSAGLYFVTLTEGGRFSTLRFQKY